MNAGWEAPDTKTQRHTRHHTSETRFWKPKIPQYSTTTTRRRRSKDVCIRRLDSISKKRNKRRTVSFYTKTTVLILQLVWRWINPTGCLYKMFYNGFCKSGNSNELDLLKLLVKIAKSMTRDTASKCLNNIEKCKKTITSIIYYIYIYIYTHTYTHTQKHRQPNHNYQ
jgi:hypothetical protein